MCGVPEQSSTNCNSATTLGDSSSSVSKEMEISGRETEDISNLLEFAANNDLDGFRLAIKDDKTKVYGVGTWYCRQNGTNHMALEQRTPAMISALYGSLDVLKCILDAFDDPQNINRRYGHDGSTALHCAASGGSERAVETIKMLLDFGADLNLPDTMGRKPADVIAIHPRLKDVKEEIERILESVKQRKAIRVDLPEEIESDLPAFLDEQIPPEAGVYPLSPSSSYSHEALNMAALNGNSENSREKDKEWPTNPSLPDIKNSIYMTDEFRMFSFKIRPCSRAYSHDWTECPFAHPGENARRRDPRRYHYSCVPCPDFRKGSCRQGDACEYAHGVFECWLHPAQYRTRLCKDGVECTRRVCFFAHTAEELRPLYISNGSTIPSPRTTSLEMSAMSPPLAPGSPSTLMMNPFFSSTNSSQMNISTPPMSPSSPVNSRGSTWSPSSVPALHLPGVGLQGSRLRAALNARDILLEVPELDTQLLNELSCVSPQALSFLNTTAASANGTSSLRAGKYRNIGLNMPSSNHEEVFASDFVCSPRAMMHDSPRMAQLESEMQFHRSAQLQSQLQNAMQAQINCQVFSGMADQTQMQLKQAALDTKAVNSPRLHSSTPFTLGSLGRTSVRTGLDSERQNSSGVPISPVAVTQAVLAQHDMKSHGSHDFGAGLSLSDWGSPTGKAEWAVQRDDLLKFRNSSPFLVKVEEPDTSLVHKPVTESSLDDDTAENTTINRTRDTVDHTVLGSWIDDMHLDRIIA